MTDTTATAPLSKAQLDKLSPAQLRVARQIAAKADFSADYTLPTGTVVTVLRTSGVFNYRLGGKACSVDAARAALMTDPQEEWRFIGENGVVFTVPGPKKIAAKREDLVESDADQAKIDAHNKEVAMKRALKKAAKTHAPGITEKRYLQLVRQAKKAMGHVDQAGASLVADQMAHAS